MLNLGFSEREGDVDLVDDSQWPDDYDFAETRTINLPVEKKAVYETEDAGTEKKNVQASVTSASDDAELDNELDPVGLEKAFGFAVWASVIMVGFRRQ